MTLAIVAIPREDDYVWKISSDKIPHMTILVLDEASQEMITHISEFLEHASDLMLDPFGMSVERRGELGDKNADVLFFEKDWQAKQVSDFRTSLLQDLAVKGLFKSIDQFPEWTPHLTLGYPESPAKSDPRDFTRFHWVEFDKVAFWTEDFAGPEFALKGSPMAVDYLAMTAMGQEYIEHHGIKGMKWGVRRSRKALERARREETRSEDSRRHLTNSKKPLSDLSDKELKDLHNRLNTEANVRKLTGEGKTAAQKLFSDINKTNAALTTVGLPALSIITKAASKPLIAAGAAAAGAILVRSSLSLLPNGKLPINVRPRRPK